MKPRPPWREASRSTKHGLTHSRRVLLEYLADNPGASLASASRAAIGLASRSGAVWNANGLIALGFVERVSRFEVRVTPAGYAAIGVERCPHCGARARAGTIGNGNDCASRPA